MPSALPAVEYRIRPANPGAHLFHVSCTVRNPDPAGQVFRLPAWIPGSYMIREFARNIVTLRAELDGEPWPVDKLDKHSWRAAPLADGGVLCLHYEIYAWDLSVRAAHLDGTHGFFNGTSVFLAVEGRTDRPCLVDIERPDGAEYRDWKVATALPLAHGVVGAARPYGFGWYRAADYDELIDHPVEMGSFALGHFEAAGTTHDVVLTGRHDCDLERLCKDLQRICEWQIKLFGAPPPMDYYAFLTMVVGDGYGGLEHRASTALLCSRADLPWKGMEGLPDGYKSFLGLCSHEYFHTWNVKRIKPAAFTPYDLTQENYTRLLWAFEGFTSYYDDLALVRSGVITPEDYLGLLGKTVSAVLRGSGRSKQSVAESSFDAWTKYYRQDENAPNAIVSYYAKGALIALALDLQLRAGSDGRTSLDDVMRLLWQRHGQTGLGVAEEGIFDAVREVGGSTLGSKLARWLKKTVEGTDDLPLAKLLKGFGIDWQAEPTAAAPSLGIKLAAGNGECRFASVHDGGAAQAAGLSAGDVLIALDGLRLGSGKALDDMLARRRPGDEVEIHAFRRDELMVFSVVLGEPVVDKISLKPAAKAAASALKLRRGWLGRAA
ncbi:M61 family metallopeptidase [Thauera sp. SDU_THAU2]|uniref:M61 family metallopeptidase n=1 Tax=Thauera sp. SDU_THAU2 TaxID=3136633 RepID=UPI00311EB34B